MAYGRKTGGRDFKPGWRGGPGAPKIPDVIRESVKMNRAEFIEIANRCLNMTKEELAQIIKAPDTPAKVMIVCSVIHHAITKGDPVRYQFLLDRLIGKAPDVVDVNVTSPYSNLSDHEKLEKAKLAVKALELRLKAPDGSD